MAKKQSNRPSQEVPRRKKPTAPNRNEASGDPLGKLVKEYRVNLAEVLAGCGFLGVIAAGILWYALAQDPNSATFLLIGGGVAVVGLWLLIQNGLNLGRHLELRKHGVRWTESGTITEFNWTDIVEIAINREDESNLGLVSVHSRSSDAVNPSGPLTKTEWEILIHSHNGKTIHLRPGFLRIVPDPKKLISQLKLGASQR